MNDRAVKLSRWLLAANGALKNVAQLLSESFGPAPVAAATVDPATITAYPVDPNAVPIGDYWSRGDNGWVHPLHSTLLPRSSTAAHHVLAGVTSRNELLVINLAAAGYLGIEGAAPVPLMRSWVMQLLATTPEARLAVDDPDLAIPSAPRLSLITGPASAGPETTALFTTGHTRGPAAPITVSGQAAGATNIVLCSGPAAGIYLANRYWPMWRRMELADAQWRPLSATLTAAAEMPLSSGNDMSPPFAAASAGPTGERRASVSADSLAPPTVPAETPPTSGNDMSPVAAGAAAPAGQPGGRHPSLPADSPAATDPPATALTSHDDMSPGAGPAAGPLEEPAAPPAADAGTLSPGGRPVRGSEDPRLPAAADLQEPPADLIPPAAAAEHPTPAVAAPESAAGPDREAQLPGPPRTEQPQRGLFALGETYALGVDSTTGETVKYPAVTRQGVRKPIKALMMLATSSGLTTPEWDKELQFNPPNRRQARTTIRKMMGGEDPIREDARGLLVTDLYCDWKEFQRLAGAPKEASTEDLTAAVALIRGAPFEDISEGEYGWRSVELLRDELLDRCSDAAIELALRQQAVGATHLAYQTARLGIRVYPRREDLWEVAVATAVDSERPGLAYDLKQAIPAPRNPDLRQLLAEARAR